MERIWIGHVLDAKFVQTRKNVWKTREKFRYKYAW